MSFFSKSRYRIRTGLLLSLVAVLTLSHLSCQKKSTSEDQTSSIGEDLQKRADSLARASLIMDGHVDLPYRMNKDGFLARGEVEDISVEVEGNFDFPKAKKGGLDAPFMSIYIPASYQEKGGAKLLADSLINMVTQLTTTFPDMFAPARTPEEIIDNFERGVVSLPLGIENGAAIEDDVSNVSYFFERGVRYMTLTHSKDNLICDSSYDDSEDTWNGLSPFGEKVLEQMNRVGMMVDISHVTDSAFYDVIRLSKAPVIATHSSCRKFTPGWMRNMDDEMIKALAARGGVIQINFGSSFLVDEVRLAHKALNDILEVLESQGKGPQDSLYQKTKEEFKKNNRMYASHRDVANHIDHVVSLVGIDHVGLGSDFDGVGDSLPDSLKDASMYPFLIRELLKRSYTQQDIKKICSLNTLRLWGQVREAAAGMQRL